MRILLAHNSLYYPSHGGGDKSNRLLMQALAAEGHQVRAVTRVERFGEPDTRKLLADLSDRNVEARLGEDGVVRFELHGVDVHTVATQPNIRQYFQSQIDALDPDVIITSTDDPGQLLFDLAVRAGRARVVYLVRATIAVPFGPDSSAPNAAKADVLKHADGVVGVSQYVADYMREHGRLDAIHVPISLLEPGPEPAFLGRFTNRYVTFVNPCAVKGITIFLELADRMPHVQFAAVPTWGTNHEDYLALTRRPNVTVIPPVDNIDDLMRQTRVLLAPSVWAEARSRIVVEAMARGVPVISSDAGGLPEAHMGIDYVLPVNVIRHYRPSVDMNMVPVADVPPQDIVPWQAALGRLWSDSAHWEEIAGQSREAALRYARNLSVRPFEQYLLQILRKPKKAPPSASLSDEKRKLLALRLKQKAAAKPANPWFAGAEDVQIGKPILLCLPWAGAGTGTYRQWRDAMQDVATVVAVRLPGRETRVSESPFTRIGELVDALGPAVQSLVGDRRFVLFGHSMGAGTAYELARWLSEHGGPSPSGLIVSAAKAPQFRTTAAIAPALSDEELIERLRRLGGIPSDVLDSPAVLSMLLPVLRADTSLYRQWVWQPSAPLQVPLFAYAGASDPNLQVDDVMVWREQTTASFRGREFPAGHFAFQTVPEEFMAALREDVSAALRRK